jgi:Domain of unknown function (DUF6458)
VTFGSSILLIAVGAILRYAVTASVSGVNIMTVGLILMIAGALGLLVSAYYAAALAPRRRAARERIVEREPPQSY